MRLHHVAIEVKDLEKSRGFYQKYLGLVEENSLLFNGENITFLTGGDFRLELISSSEQFSSNPSSVHLCFEVNSIKGVTKRFNDDGIFAMEGPYKLENGWETIFFQGPDDEVIEFLQIGGKAD